MTGMKFWKCGIYEKVRTVLCFFFPFLDHFEERGGQVPQSQRAAAVRSVMIKSTTAVLVGSVR